MNGGRAKLTESPPGPPSGEDPTATATHNVNRRRASRRSIKRLRVFGSWLVLSIACLYGLNVVVTAIDYPHFQPNCLDDGVLYGRKDVVAPLDPYYLGEVAGLAEDAGFATVQLGPFLWVSEQTAQASPSVHLGETPFGPVTAEYAFQRDASFIAGYYYIAVTWGPSPLAQHHRDVLENNPALVRRIELLDRWIDTDPPGYWSNPNHFPAMCFARLAFLRPTWAQMPWELMPRLIWQDQLQRIGAVLNGLPAR